MPTTLVEVTASALNLRAAPRRDSTVLAVLNRGASCVVIDPGSDGWLHVSHGGASGFVSSAFVRAANVPGPVVATPVAAPSVPVLSPSGLDVERREQALDALHPQFRERVVNALATLATEGIPFRVFEAFRQPERQQWLFAQGRTRPGAVVTKARPWESFHQFGLAVDLVLFEGGRWSWDDSGPRAAPWRRMGEVVAAVGLRTLSFERPHAELPVSLATWDSGELLASGDATWRDNLALAAERWRRNGGDGAPAIPLAERPPLTV